MNTNNGLSTFLQMNMHATKIHKRMNVASHCHLVHFNTAVTNQLEGHGRSQMLRIIKVPIISFTT